MIAHGFSDGQETLKPRIIKILVEEYTIPKDKIRSTT